MGEDNLVGLENWKNYNKILEKDRSQETSKISKSKKKKGRGKR